MSSDTAGLGQELLGVPQPPDKGAGWRKRPKKISVTVVGGRLRVRAPRVGRGRASRGKKTNLLALLRRAARMAGLPIPTMGSLFRKQKYGDGRNHGYTKSGQGGRTGRGGYRK